MLNIVRARWLAHRRTVLPFVIGLLSVLALLKVGIELHRLVAGTGYYGAIDLLLRFFEVERWFAGRPVYTELTRVTYPPQAYIMLWPFTGWLGQGAARWLWAITSLAALAWLCWLAVRESGARDKLEIALAIAMVASMNAVGVTIGNGQLILHLLPALIAGLLLLRRPHAAWYTDVAAALLLLFALIKPTLSAPFVWVALMTSRRVRPLAITAIGYVLMTILAASFQPEGVFTLVGQWLGQAGSHPGDGNGDLHALLRTVGLDDWSVAASLAVLAVLAVWTWRRRTADVWVLIGVAAIVARLWAYHRVYDDVLILLPMIALFRIAVYGPSERGDDVVAGILLAASIALMSMPARFLGGAESVLFVSTHLAVWLATLLFLVRAPRLHGATVSV